MRGVFVLLLVLAAVVTSSFAATEGNRVLAIELDNDINPVTRDFVEQQIERANDQAYDAVVIVLDTPGGLVDSMEDIVKAELGSQIPVVVYVAPAGAEASSAGAFIAQAADVLAMAPQTTIGSSTPVGAGGEDLPEDMREKAVEKLSAQLRGLAKDHGRNPDIGERAVRYGDNWNDREAVAQDIADVRAVSLEALLERIDGRRTNNGRLRTANANVTTVELGLWKQVQDLLIDPNVVYVLLSIGLIGLVVELWNPGLIFPGTVGAISLIVSLWSAQVLPVSWAGILLMVLAAAFLAAEPFVVSHGALAVAGGVCFVLGGLLLFEPSEGTYAVSLPLLLGLSGALTAMMLAVVYKIVQVRRRPVEVGVQSVVGAHGVVRRDGFVFVNGELWRARSKTGEALRTGDEVAIERVEGLELVVRSTST